MVTEQLPHLLISQRPLPALNVAPLSTQTGSQTELPNRILSPGFVVGCVFLLTPHWSITSYDVPIKIGQSATLGSFWLHKLQAGLETRQLLVGMINPGSP